MTTEELPFYWPGACDQCLLAAGNQSSVDVCQCQGESYGFDHTQLGSHMCNREGTKFSLSFGERRSLLFRLSRLDPAKGSQLWNLDKGADLRPVIFLADSTGKQQVLHLEFRAAEVGVKTNILFNPGYDPKEPIPSKRTPQLVDEFPIGLGGLARGIDGQYTEGDTPVFKNEQVWISLADRARKQLEHDFSDGVRIFFNLG